MNNKLKNKVHVLLALFLTVVLSGTILVKPVHILLVHHELTELTSVHSNGTTLANPDHQDCLICDFEFCSFISSTPIIVPKVAVTYATEMTPRTIDRLTNLASHYFQLRAPPVA